MFTDKVVVRYADGTLVKGFGEIFFPADKTLEVMDSTNKIHFVDLGKVFAVFFVRDFDGNPGRERGRVTTVIRSYSYGEPVEVTLTNGEKLQGKTVGERGKNDSGMFLHPLDPNSNNLNIFLPFTSVKAVVPIADPEDSGGKRPIHPAMRR